MHLYTYSPSPNGKRVGVVLREKGIEIATTEVDILAGENLTDEYRAKNPMSRVPVLELDNGFMLAESIAISRYLEGLHPEPRLFGAGFEEQAVIEMWNRRAELNFFLHAAAAFRHSTGIFQDRESVCPEWGEIDAALARTAAEAFEAHLAENEFLAGDRFSIADVTLGCALTFARNTGLDVLDNPNLAAYFGRVRARPGFAKDAS